MPMQTKCDILILPERDTIDYSMLGGETKTPENPEISPRPVLQLALNDMGGRTSTSTNAVVMKVGDLKFAVGMDDLRAAVQSFDATLKGL